MPSSSFISQPFSIFFPAQCTFWQSSNNGNSCKGCCLFLGTLPFFKNVAQPQITWDLKYFPGLETFSFWMEIHSMEAWSLTKMKMTVMSSNSHKVVFTCGFEPPLLCSMPSSLWASPRTSSPWVPTLKQEASKRQAAAISIRFNDLQEPPKNRLEVNASLLPLKRSEPRLQSFQVLSSTASM